MFDPTGQTAVTDPAAARTLLAWLEALADCNQAGLARKAGLNSRTLRHFAAGDGGRKTAARLAAVAGVPDWVVQEIMLPTIAVVDLVWRRATGVDEVFLEARSQALEIVPRIGLLEILTRSGQKRSVIVRPGLHPADVRVLLRWLGSLGEWSQDEIAERCGLSRTMLWLYKTGEHRLRRTILRRIAKGAGLPVWLSETVVLRAITTVRLVTEHPHPDQIAGWRRTLAAAFPRPGRPISPRPER